MHGRWQHRMETGSSAGAAWSGAGAVGRGDGWTQGVAARRRGGSERPTATRSGLEFGDR